jgi:hypothetical protein
MSQVPSEKKLPRHSRNNKPNHGNCDPLIKVIILKKIARETPLNEIEYFRVKIYILDRIIQNTKSCPMNEVFLIIYIVLSSEQFLSTDSIV